MKIKGIILMITALLLNAVVGGTVFAAVGLPAIVGGVGLPVVSLLSPMFGIEGLRAGIYTEVWTKEMIKAFRTSVESIGWLNKIKSYDQYAENDVIHFVQLGGDPDVLINNTTYPIDVQSLTDIDKPVSLDKYQTKATPITDDELHAISYDRMASVIERHKDAVNESKYKKALHALAPAGNTTATPVLLTTGANSEDGTRKTIARADIINLKKQFDKLKVPVVGRVLVLCPDHVADLLTNDQKFADQYYNYQSGKISNLYGFEVYEFADAPAYSVATKTKLSFGADVTGGNQYASVAFYAPRCMKAAGSTTTYPTAAEATKQEHLFNVRHYFIALPLKQEAIGAIVSGAPDEEEEPAA